MSDTARTMLKPPFNTRMGLVSLPQLSTAWAFLLESCVLYKGLVSAASSAVLIGLTGEKTVLLVLLSKHHSFLEKYQLTG